VRMPCIGSRISWVTVRLHTHGEGSRGSHFSGRASSLSPEKTLLWTLPVRPSLLQEPSAR
ncbi:MAG: hypothetical protein ACK57W_02700, partial [Flavobacteriales bacterium]